MDKAELLASLEAQCAKREYCNWDILRKISEKGPFSKEDATEILSKLQSEGFVDDLRFSTAFSRDKAQLLGWGEAKIRLSLRVKGIDRETIDEALSQIDTNKAEAKLRKLMEAKWKTLQDDPQGKFKLLRYALGRGYDYEQVRPIAEGLCSCSAEF